MNSLISVDLPETVSVLVSQLAFDQYTVSGPDSKMESILRNMTAEDFFPGGIGDRDLAQCCLAAMWLLHNFLDQSHEISQQVYSPEGSYWHGIMHRLEGDFSNSKYWYRKVGDHPVFATMRDGGTWNPYNFVDQCESLKFGGDESAKAVQTIAVSEWKALFEYCFDHAAR